MIKFTMIHHVDRQTIAEMYRTYAPVFILSTGRSGSKFITALLDCSAAVTAFHEPRPTLQFFSNYVFHHQQETETLTRIIDAARMEAILEVFIKDKIYIESNQCLTFFAPVLSRLFKNSKFIHLVRHPGDFVRSAVRKGWHKNDSIWEAGRVQMADKEEWARLDQIERLGWVWLTTNAFIEDFKKQIESRRLMTCKLEDLVESVKSVKKLLEFIGIHDIKRERIEELQREKINQPLIHPYEPANMQKTAEFPSYPDWTPQVKDKLKRYAADLARVYGYRL